MCFFFKKIDSPFSPHFGVGRPSPRPNLGSAPCSARIAYFISSTGDNFPYEVESAEQSSCKPNSNLESIYMFGARSI